VQDDLNESFAIQWDKFWDVQLDSRNGTTQSRDRLLEQSQMKPEDFRGKTVLEVGCGAGRFTEVLLAMGARIVSFDYSAAVDVNARVRAEAIERGDLLCGQGDVFELPVKKRAFDIVLCYGVIQHTADAPRALTSLWEHVAPGGRLLVDRYQLDLQHVMPFKYALRPLTKRLPPHMLLKAIETYCRAAVPVQEAVLSRLTGNGIKRWLRLVVNRSPNSVYPINLWVNGELVDRSTAFRWSVLDTFDQYAPAFDDPCTGRTWRKEVSRIPEARVLHLGSGGQGNVAVLERTA
jgi:2-polyprenyl-3-methyl-5-hydroxy-6-metoxy-1,4-benzoquinol methylase